MERRGPRPRARRLAAAVLAGLCFAAPVAAARSVNVSVSTSGPAPPEVRLEVVDPEAPDSRRTETLHLTEGAGRITLALPPDRAVTISAHAPGTWSRAVDLPPASAGSEDVPESIVLRLWPAATLDAAVETPRDAAPVEIVSLGLGAATAAREGGPGQPPGTPEIRCPVDRGRLSACQAPAGEWDLRVQASGFAPEHFWARSLAAGKATDLGAIRLRRGGSVFGTVTTEAGAADPEAATVALRPVLASSPSSPTERERLERLTREARLDERGQFQVVGVSPGSYEVEVTQKGWSPARVGPLAVAAGAWTEVDEVMLHPLLRLTVLVQPGVGTFGAPWEILLHPDDGIARLGSPAGGRTSDDGTWVSPPLPEGSYWLQVLDEQGASMEWREIELAPGLETVSVDLPAIFVAGEVRLGDQPLPGARVFFGGMTGAVRIETEADEDGAFVAVLPRDGEWTVDVRADEPPVTSRGLEVEVEAGSDRKAEVVVELPDTSLAGTVVDEEGRPPRQPAILRISSYGEWRGVVRAEGDVDGHFEVRGLRPGPYAILAMAGDLRSQIRRLEVAPDGEYELRLIVRSSTVLAGRVIDENGPVPAAQVYGTPLSGSGELPRLSSAESGPDGRFEIEIPAGTRQARLLVLAPGHLLHHTQASASDGIEIALDSRPGGTLMLETVAPEGSRGGTAELVLMGGGVVDLPRLESWARMNGVAAPRGGAGAEGEGRRLAIPALPPGEYSYCRLSLDEAILVLGGAAFPTSGACSTGYLASGGELVLGPPD